MLMVLRSAGLHVRTLGACAASRKTERRRIGAKSLFSSALRASTQRRASALVDPSAAAPSRACCSLLHQARAAPWPDQRARRSPAASRTVGSNSSSRAASSAGATVGTPATETEAQLPGADSYADSDAEDEDLPKAAPAPDARLDPGLYLVATPIGNLEDITLRAVRVLRCADRVLAEDTRHTRKLLNHLGIRTPLTSFHEHNERGKQAQVLQQLGLGAALALVSDAGMPAISDPGALLVAAAAAAGHRVIPIPGPSAVLAALTASGLPTESFMFVGFLPAKASARKQRLEELAGVQATLIAYVPPHSLAAVLEAAAGVLGPERRCVVARELTKLHEELFRTSLGAAAEHYALNAPRGEITLVIEGAPEAGPQSLSQEELVAALQQALDDGHSASSAVKVVRASTGAPKRDLYQLAVQLAGQEDLPSSDQELAS